MWLTRRKNHHQHRDDNHDDTLKVNVEDIRSGVINKKNKISIQDVENLAMMLSRSFSSHTYYLLLLLLMVMMVMMVMIRSSKRVTELQRKLPGIQQKLTMVRGRDEQAILLILSTFVNIFAINNYPTDTLIIG